MSIRTTSSTVSFFRPFVLTGIAGEQPAGSYTVETDEELLQIVHPVIGKQISIMPPRMGDVRELTGITYVQKQ